MSRIRTIKPEFWTSSQVAECSPTARLLFVGMWTFADDAGNQRADLKRLKMEVFPGDAFDNEQMRTLVAELLSQELIVEYEAEGGVFWHITGFRSHQKIDKPSYKFPEYSGNGRRPFDDHSTTIPRTFGDSSPPEGSLMESKGMESKGMEKKPPKSPKGDFDPVDIAPCDIPFYSVEFQEAWSDFCKMRREIKKPLRETGAKASLKKLGAMGEARAIAALEHTTANEWQGIREPETAKDNGQPKVSGMAEQKRLAAEEARNEQ